jgi:Cyclic nucleotide-binding domain/PilZ domain
MRSLFVHQRKNLRVGWRTHASILVMRDLRVIKAVTRNVSVHGALLFVDKTLEVGTKIQITLDLQTPGLPLQEEIEWPLEIPGVVARNEFGVENTMAVTYDTAGLEQMHALRAAVFYQAMRLMQRISEFPAFRDLSELDQMALTTVCHEVELEEGEQLARLGDEATSLFLVKSGRVMLCAPHKEGRDQPPVERAHAGQVFGEVAALLDLPHNLDIIAETRTELLAIPRDALHFLRDLNPNLALALYEIFAAFMGRRLRKLTTRVFTPLNC